MAPKNIVMRRPASSTVTAPSTMSVYDTKVTHMRKSQLFLLEVGGGQVSFLDPLQRIAKCRKPPPLRASDVAILSVQYSSGDAEFLGIVQKVQFVKWTTKAAYKRRAVSCAFPWEETFSN